MDNLKQLKKSLKNALKKFYKLDNRTKNSNIRSIITNNPQTIKNTF